MYCKNRLFSLLCAAVFSTGAAAQTVVPKVVPPNNDKTPAPFSYPADFASPTFDQKENIGSYLQLGVFDVILGQTPLSIAIHVLGGELHFTQDKTPFLCYSAPVPEIQQKVKTKKKTEEKEEEPAEPFFQNIWLTVGSRGEISEARLQKLNATAQMCPPLPEAYREVSINGIFINETARQLKSLVIPGISAENAESQWKYWFSLLPSDRPGYNQAGLFGIKLDNDTIDQIISVSIPLKAQ